MGRRLALGVSVALLLLATFCRATTTSGTQKTIEDDGLNLEEALIGDGDDSKKPAPAPPRPKPGSHGNTGEFSDSDLYDGELPPEKPRSGGQDPAASEGSQGMLAGIVSSVVVAIVGALSSFIAYQKKKLCFKASDQENVHMESQQGIHAEPPVQRTLLQKQ